MPSQFFGLYVAGSGLRASNAALNTTANNISNAQTTGYSRQTVTQQASSALRTFTTYGCAGAGVDTIAIERVRNSFYDVKYWNNASNYGNYTAKQYYARTIEDYFKDDGKSGFTTVFSKFSSSLQAITTNASSDSTKAEFIASAKALTDYFNNMYGNLQEIQKDVNLEIKQNVDQINSISEKLATLNKQINVIELTGAQANELRDQRELLVDELSEIVDVEIDEMPIFDSNEPDRETGGHRYLVRIAGGQPLVDGNYYNQLKYVAKSANEKTNQTDVDGLYQIQWENGNQFSLTNASMGGKLKGLVEMRDGNNGANFNGMVTGYDDTTNQVSIKVTEENLKDMKQCMLPDPAVGGTINIGNTIYQYTGWTFDGTDTYTFTINNSSATYPQATAAKVNGREAETETDINYQGIPYYMQQMNTWIRGFSEQVNEILKLGVNANGDPGCILFTGKSGNGTEYTDANFGDVDAYYELSAGNFDINSALIDDASLLGSRSSEKVGVEECGQIEEIITLLNSKEKYSFRNGSAGEMLEMILSDVALNASNANTFQDVYKSLKNSIDNQRSSVAGVDEDEEAVSLVKFQNSYTLASKMIQTLTEIYDQLILNTGV